MQKALDIKIPDDILLILMLFYPKNIEFEGCTIKLTDDEKEMITNWLLDTFNMAPGNAILSSQLLYDKGKDGTSLENIHKKCEGIPNTFGVIKNRDYDHLIGYFF